jgi:hypothetical protein
MGCLKPSSQSHSTPKAKTRKAIHRDNAAPCMIFHCGGFAAAKNLSPNLHNPAAMIWIFFYFDEAGGFTFTLRFLYNCRIAGPLN